MYKCACALGFDVIYPGKKKKPEHKSATAGIPTI